MKLRVCLFAFAAVAMTSAAQAQSSEIVFSSDRPGLPTDFDIWRMDEDGTPQNRLTSEIGDTRRPSKSFDGQKIVYDNNSDLLMINSDGTGYQNLTAGLSFMCGNSLDFCWDADAHPSEKPGSGGDFYIVFTRETYFSGGPGPAGIVDNLYLATVDVSEGELTDIIQLTDSEDCLEKRHYHAAWCGRTHIVWSREIDSLCSASPQYKWEICTAPVDPSVGFTEAPTCHPPTHERADQWPSCNTLRTKIAFARSDGLLSDDEPHEICTMDFDGSNEECLENLADPNNDWDDTRPTWSPSGSQIAFASERQAMDLTTDWEIWVVNADLTGTPENRTDADGDDDDPDWGPVKLP